MSTKSELLALLEKQGDAHLSGEEAAARLHVSRAAVWKAVKALRGGGLQVESVPGLGYRLAPGSDVLSADAVAACMPENAPPVRVLEEVDSTNLEAKRWAIDGAPHGAMVVAAAQTAGRGRLGRSFSSPPGGLYLSVVLRPSGQMPASQVVLITPAAAVAACRAVQQLCGVSLGIKWVNDLYIEKKKCCGILTEASTGFENGAIEYLVTGIGINYTTPQSAFPPEVAPVATALFPADGAHRVPPVPRARLAAAVHTQLLQAFEKLAQKAFLEEYRARSIVLGKEVTVMATPPYQAKAVAIDDEARLVVENAAMDRLALAHGEISVRL